MLRIPDTPMQLVEIGGIRRVAVRHHGGATEG